MKSLIAAAITAFIILLIVIVGTSVAHAGDRIPKAEIILVKQGSNDRFVARSDDSGRFSLAGLPAGEYTVSISESGFRSSLLSGGEAGSAATDYSLKISATRAPARPVGVRRFYSGIPITVGADGTVSGAISVSRNVTSARDAGSGMATGR